MTIAPRMLDCAALTLLACLHIVPAHGLVADPATAFNQRYNDMRQACENTQPGLLCSGLILHPLGSKPTADFWAPTPDEAATGSMAYLYLRRDSPLPSPSGNPGFVLADPTTARDQGKPMNINCPPTTSATESGNPGCTLSPWSADVPGLIPVQALYYDPAHDGQLSTAQHYQSAWFTATREWVPILRLAFDEGHARFTFVKEDQMSQGQATVEQLNRNFRDIRRECPDGKAPPFCSGVVIRAVWPETGAWNPNENAIAKNGVSASYLRADVYFYSPYRPMGLVFHTLDTTGTMLYPLKPRCVYAPDGNLHVRSDGCGPADLRSGIGGPCELHGIDTVEKWLAYYAQHGTRGQCSLAITPDAFEIMAQARRTFQRPPNHHLAYEARNELVIEPWPREVASALPLAAFYYSSGEQPSGAQFLQVDYYTATGRFIPVVMMEDPVPLSGRVFRYRDEDQAIVIGEQPRHPLRLHQTPRPAAVARSQ